MIGRVLPGLTTAAAVATAVVVVVNPAVPSLPDVQIPALFPTQVDMPTAAKAVTGAAEVAVPAVKAAVRSMDAGRLIPSPAALEETVARVAAVVVPSPDVASLMHAARALTVRANTAGDSAATARTVAVSQISDLAGTQRITNRPALVRPFRIQSGPANVPPPMASVPAGSVPPPTESAPTPGPKPSPKPSPKPTRGFGPGADHSPQARQINR